MINVGYVNGSIDLEFENIFNQYNSFLESCDKEINSMFAEFDVLHEKVTLESEIMGIVPERMMVVYEAGKENIFTKIGNMIMSLYNSIMKAIDDIIDKIKNFSFKKKTDIQKLEVLLKKHPELKDEAVGAFRKGELDLSDIRNLKDLDDAFDAILKMSREKDDPDAIKTKWEKAKAKFEKDGVVVTAAKKTATVVGAAAAVAMFIPNCSKAIDELKKRKAERKETMAKAISAVEELQKDGKADKSTNSLHTILQAQRYIDGKYASLLSNTSSAWTKMVNGLTSLVVKIPKIGAKIDNKETSKIEQTKGVIGKKEDAERKAKEDERKADEESAYIKAYQSAAGRRAEADDAKDNNPQP